MRSTFLIICSIFTLKNLGSDNFYTIPQNERIGEKLVADGKLEADFFEQIKPFYNQPIDVPQGELKILLELFPQLSIDIPLSTDYLKKYAPWDQPAIIRFFQDYPDLAQFKPILRFDIKPTDFRAKVAFSIRNGNNPQVFSHGANLSVDFSESFKMDTRITFNSNYARWYRRTFYLAPTDKCSFQIGNFGTFFDKGLFYGYFHPTDVSEKSKANNWLYGSTRTWNGVKVQIAEPGKEILKLFSATAFFHKRETETSGGTVLNIRVNEKISVNSGISLLSLYRNSENSHYAHCGIKMKFNSLSMEIQSGADIENPGGIPFFMESRYKFSSNRLDFTFVFLPKDFNAPCSYLAHKSNKDEIISAVSIISIQSVHHLQNWVSLIPSVKVELTEQRTKNACFRVSIINSLPRFKYRLTYSLIPECGLTDTSGNSFRNTLSICLSRKIVVGSEIDFQYRDRFNYSVNGLLDTRVELFPAMTLQPLISFSHAKGENCSFAYGFEQILKLQNNTFTQLKVEQSIRPRKKGESLSVEAKTSFLF